MNKLKIILRLLENIERDHKAIERRRKKQKYEI